MVKIEVNGPNVYTALDGKNKEVCVDALLAMNSIYCRIVEDMPETAEILRTLISELVNNGMLFEDDHDDDGVLDDIPTTATKSRP